MNEILEFSDFSGGMTDHHIDCAPNKFKLAENFFLSKDSTGAALETRHGSDRDDTDAPLVSGGVTRIGALIPLGAKLLKQNVRTLQYINAVPSPHVMVTLTGPTGNNCFADGDVFSAVAATFWNKHAYLTNDTLATSKVQKVYYDDSDELKLRTAGLPALASSPLVSGGGSGGPFTYLYRFLYRHTYLREGDVEFEVLGPTTEVTKSRGTITAVDFARISSIPVLANGAADNYDTDNITVDIYRTTADGRNFFYVGRVTNGTTTYDDGTTDAVLLDSTPLYTEGGALDNDPPPVCKYIHATETCMYYAHILELGETLSNEIRQSKPGIYEAVPGSFSAQVDDDIVGISSVRGVPVVFCASSVYRLDGVLDDFGQGELKLVKISDKIGCAGHLSIVQTLDTLYFAGTDGFYATDGYKVIPLSPELQETYADIVETATQRKRICGVFDPIGRRIWWGCNPENSVDNTHAFIFDLTFGAFTVIHGKRFDNDGEELTTAWTASALAYFNNRIYRATNDGYTYRHDQELFNDERLVSAEWVQQPIQYKYEGPATSFGNKSLRKWVPFLIVNAEPSTNVTCQPQGANNLSQSFHDLKEIYVKTLIEWGDSYWGDEALWADSGSAIKQKRGFPANSLWCFYKQIRLKNSFSNITSSDARSAGTVAGTTSKTLTLPDYSGGPTFPPNCIDYYVKVLKSDGTFTREFLITAQDAANEITFSDADQECPTGSDLRWVIRGYFKGDGLKLLSYSFLYKSLTPTQTPYQGAQGGLDTVQV